MRQFTTEKKLLLNKELFMTINIDDKVLDYLKKINSKAITIDLIGCAS